MHPHNPKALTHKKDLEAAAAIPLKPVKREVETSANGFSIYSNDVQVQVTPWDVRFTFGEITDALPVDNDTAVLMKINVLGNVRISPQLAKRLVGILLSQIRTYEQTFGEIPVPKD